MSLDALTITPDAPTAPTAPSEAQVAPIASPPPAPSEARTITPPCPYTFDGRWPDSATTTEGGHRGEPAQTPAPGSAEGTTSPPPPATPKVAVPVGFLGQRFEFDENVAGVVSPILGKMDFVAREMQADRDRAMERARVLEAELSALRSRPAGVMGGVDAGRVAKIAAKHLLSEEAVAELLDDGAAGANASGEGEIQASAGGATEFPAEIQALIAERRAAEGERVRAEMWGREARKFIAVSGVDAPAEWVTGAMMHYGAEALNEAAGFGLSGESAKRYAMEKYPPHELFKMARVQWESEKAEAAAAAASKVSGQGGQGMTAAAGGMAVSRGALGRAGLGAEGGAVAVGVGGQRSGVPDRAQDDFMRAMGML